MRINRRVIYRQQYYDMGLRIRKAGILFTILVLTICPLRLYSQNFIEDFKAINKAYVSGNLSFNLRYDYYNDYKSTKPDYFYTGIVKLKGTMVYYKMNDMEFCYDSIYTCMVDGVNKNIMFDTVWNRGNMSAKINFVDSLTRVYKSYEYKAMENNMAKYTIYSVSPGVSYSEIVFDKTTKLIHKITIYFFDNRDNAKPGSLRNKLVINYTNINTNANNPNTFFRAQRMVQIKGKKVTAQAAYRQYDIINNMEEQ